MPRYKKLSRKLQLGKEARRTRWAPFWVIFKALGKGKKLHPSVLTRVKRNWRKKKIKKKTKKEIKSGRIEKKY